MSNLSKALIAVAVGLAVAVGVAWNAFGPPPQPSIAPDARTSGDPVKQPAQPVESAATVAEDPIEPEATVADHEPAGTDTLPLDLTDQYGFKATDFDKVPQYPWPAVPRGAQTFANVPLEIGGAMILWGERNAKNGQVFPEKIADIPLQRKFETLYICHGTFFEGEAGTPTCEVVFHYDDGTTASDTIVCGSDTRDWFANRAKSPLGPSGLRSTLAWIGDGKAGDRPQTIRFCLTAMENPHPDKEVTTLDFVSSKMQAAACILAVTTGKSGVMKGTEETPPGEARGNEESGAP
jgi:hypothetical protein